MKITRGARRRKTREIMKLSPEEPAKSEAEPRSSRPQGVIRFETGRLPSEFISYQEKRESNLPGKVVIVIVTLALIFIALIAWFIANEPPK